MQVLRVLLSMLLLLVAAAAPLHAAGGGGTAARYLVFQTQLDGSVRAVFDSQVTMRGVLRGRGHTGARAAGRETDYVDVTLEDARRAVVFQDTVEIPRWIRGEFHGNGPGASGEFTIDGHVLPRDTAAFVVRVPDVAGASLTLDSPRLAQTARFDLDALASDSTVRRSAPAPQPPPLSGWNNGDPANRLDILIMGDGYTSGQQTQFDADALNLANDFFSISPYDDYRNYANVSALFTASAQSGVDQPPYNASCTEYSRVQTCCADPDASGTTPTTVNTAFNGTFCSFNIQRLATVDGALVYAAAAAEPDWDEILVLVHSSTYGGSGGGISVITTNSSAVEVAQHEFGHTFVRLADEYSNAYPGFPACSDVTSGPACEANVTDQTSRPLIKWTRWIDGAQPVPSIVAPPVATDAGLWEGARYLTTGMYRQGYSCIMQYLGSPFCDAAAEQYPLRLYGGGWGVPAAGIDTIEPGSESPAPGIVSAPYPGGSYSATLLGPQAGPNVSAEWLVDSVLTATQSVATGGVASHALVTSPGPHTVELRVTDTSPIIHSTMQAGLASSRTWNVTVGPNLCGNSVLDAGEACDDANPTGGDGCSATCQVETCWQCTGLPSVCTPDNGASCSTGDPCIVSETCSGSTCGGGTTITVCTTGDGCCPVGCTGANDADCGPHTLGAKKILIKDKPDPTKRKIVFLTKDIQIDSSTTTGIDPVADGASLQIYNANGSGESVCMALPATNWQPAGTPPLLNYKYKDTAFANGPCKVAVVKHAKLLKVVCLAKIQPIAYSLNEPSQGAMAVRFTSGAKTYCASFGGLVKKDSGTDPPVVGGKGQFSAKDAPAPFACPPAPVSCP